MADDVSSLHSILPEGDLVPKRVQLVPGGTFFGQDGRGPYKLTNPDAVIAASLKPGERLVFDENHASDHALKSGIAAPARGWITGLHNVDGAIWGDVEWTDAGRALLERREYRGISPVFNHGRTDGVITRVLRATLTNLPNLDLPALHSQEPARMDLAPALRAALGLPDTADEPAIIAAATAARTAIATHAQQLASIAGAAKLDAKLDAGGIATALQARGAGGTLEEMVALQTRVNELEGRDKRRDAEIAIDAAMKAGKPIPANKRDDFIARHMQDPAATKAWLEIMPNLNSGGVPPGPGPDGKERPSDSDQAVIAMMGLDPTAFAKAKQAEATARGVAA